MNEEHKYYEKMLAELFKCKARVYEAGEDENVTFKVKFTKKYFTEYIYSEYICSKEELDTICETRHVLFEKKQYK